MREKLPLGACQNHVAVPRRVCIKKSDPERHGYTTGCQKCQAIANGQLSSHNHSDKCRERIMQEIAKTDEGKERIAQM